MTTSWPRILLLYGIGVVAAGQLGVLPPLLPALRADFGMSLAASGLAVSVVTMIGAAFGTVAGNWCERMGHGRALAGGMLVMALAAALCAAARSADMLVAARALAGAGYLLVVVAAPSLMAGAALRRHLAIVLSLWSTFVPVGLALAGSAAASLADHLGWRSILVIDAALLAIGTTAALAAGQRPVPPRHTARTASFEGVRAVLPLAISFFSFALLFLALASLLPDYFVQTRRLSTQSAGRMVALATSFGIVGSLAAGWAMRGGMSPSRLIALGLVGSATLATLALHANLPLPLVVAGLAGSFAMGGLVPAAACASVPLIATTARAIGPMNGVLAQAGSLGSLAGPPLLALWVEWCGWPLAPVALLAVAAIGAASAFSMRR